MAETPFRWTVDVEFDGGGRNNGAIGIDEGIPRILELFHKRGIRGIFFISTEVVQSRKRVVRNILDYGHQIGSHGHFHVRYKNAFRAEDDKRISEKILYEFTKKQLPYRAPKFSYWTECLYSRPQNHVGLLKHLWFGQKITKDSIFYFHPFDIVKGNAPNLFCKLWYSQPERAYDLLSHLTSVYPGDHRL